MGNKYQNIATGEVITLPCTIEWNGMFVAPRPQWLLAHGWEEYVEPVHVPTLDEVKAAKIGEIEAYDTSSAVNEFTLFGTPMWLDKATRVGLVNAVNAEKALGNEVVALGLGGSTYELNCDTAISMLYALESYALKCYNKTLAHKQAVNALESKEEVEAYDYTIGYPEHLNFQ